MQKWQYEMNFNPAEWGESSICAPPLSGGINEKTGENLPPAPVVNDISLTGLRNLGPYYDGTDLL